MPLQLENMGNFSMQDKKPADHDSLVPLGQVSCTILSVCSCTRTHSHKDGLPLHLAIVGMHQAALIATTTQSSFS